MNSLYDVYLGDITSLQGYRCRTFLRDSAPLVAPRFSTGQQGESDLDLLKVEGIQNLSGGMFQREHEDNQKAARVLGMVNKYDQNVYPMPPPTTSNTSLGIGLVKDVVSNKAENSQYAFFSKAKNVAGVAYNFFDYYVAGATFSVGSSLPAGWDTGPVATTGQIVDMTIHRGYVYMAFTHSTGTRNALRYNIAAGTYQDIGGNICNFASLRGILYGYDSAGNMYTVTNEFAAGAATYTLVDTFGVPSYTNDMKEFNGAIYVAKPDGIWRFDGVKGMKILDLVTTEMQVFNGALYFVSGKWLYKFDGVNVTRLAYLPETFTGFTASPDYLFIATQQLMSTYLTDDVYGTSFSTTDYYRRIYSYDGVGFTLAIEKQLTAPDANSSLILYTSNQLIDAYYVTASGTLFFVYFMAGLFDPTTITTASKVQITSSEMHAGFPSVLKSLESIDVQYTDMIAGDAIQVGYKTYNGKVWSAWQNLGTITSTTSDTIELTDASKKLFKKIRFSLVVSYAAGSTLKVRGGYYHYTLQPRARWRWQTTLMAAGNGNTKDRAGSLITEDSNALNNLVTKAIRQKTPLFMLAPDYGLVKTTANAAATSFVIKGQFPMYTDPYSEYALIAVKNNSNVWEILRVSTVEYNAGADDTTITVFERGYYGVTAAQLTAGAEVHPAYKVYVTRLLRDNVILDEPTYNEQDTTGETQLQREFMLEITEV